MTGIDVGSQRAAAAYIARGWYPVPLRPHTKNLRDKEGLRRVYSPEDFGPEDNLGLHLVDTADHLRSVKLVAADFDAPEIGLTAVRTFLPSSAGWGRKSKPVSQVLYVCPMEKSLQHKDRGYEPDPGHPDMKATLIELRASGHSMAPPSVHPCGESLHWLSSDLKTQVTEPPEVLAVAPTALRRGVDLLATHAMIVRYYPPPGARHSWGLYLAGFLKQLGVTEEEATSLFRLACEAVGDRETKNRFGELESTFSKNEDDPTGGATKLAEEMGAPQGKKFVETLTHIWRGPQVERGKPKRNIQTVVSFLRRMHVEFSRDAFRDVYLVNNGGGELPRVLDDAALDDVWLGMEENYGFRPDKSYFQSIAQHLGRQHTFHPVCDYLASLVWDGTPRVGRWLVEYGQAEDSEYVKEVGRLVLVAAVRRARRPGCKFDELLILESPQGWNKSTALLALCPKEEWFSTGLPLGSDAKIIVERTQGRWIIEVAELLGNRREAEHIKSSLSTQVDGPVRLAYGRIPVSVPRQFVVIGTTNQAAYLRDRTGNRRFWPVEVGKFDVGAIARDRDQLWAEAAMMEARGDSIRMDPSLYGDAAEEQEARTVADRWQQRIEDFLADRGGPKQRVGYEALWAMLGVELSRTTEWESGRLDAIMRKLGFRKMTVRTGGRNEWGWGRDL